MTEQQGKLGVVERLKIAITGKRPFTTVQDSKRFFKIGMMKYPETEDRHLRLFGLMEILEKIEKDLERMATMTDAEKGRMLALHIMKRHTAFMIWGSPWIRGLDKRDLADKQNMVFKFMMMFGHMPSFYPDIKYIGDILLSYSWQAIDVTPQTPMMFESRAIVKEETARIDLGSEVKTY